MKRIQKVNELLKEELSKILDRLVEFPEGALITLTRAEVSEDKLYANAYVSLLPLLGFDGSNISDNDILNILKKNVFAIQQELNRKLRIRPVPKIRFLIDEAEKRRERIEELLSGREE